LEVEIGIERFCGQHITEAKLQTNLWYLLELLKKKFTELQNRTKDAISFSEVFFNSQSGIIKLEFDNIVSCRPCGTKNRIGNHAPSQTPICGKCKHEIKAIPGGPWLGYRGSLCRNSWKENKFPA
jgi:hypothetical protein